VNIDLCSSYMFDLCVIYNCIQSYNNISHSSVLFNYKLIKNNVFSSPRPSFMSQVDIVQPTCVYSSKPLLMMIALMMEAVRTSESPSTATRLHGATSQKALISMLAAVRTRNLTCIQSFSNRWRWLAKYLIVFQRAYRSNAKIKYL
jgi:hypothetical protein